MSDDSGKLRWYESLAKVELHLHLEGAIPHEALFCLIEKYGGDPGIRNLDALRKRFIYRDFQHFISTWCWKNQYLREYEDFTLIAASVAKELSRQNIRYAEVFFSPADFASHRLIPQEITSAIRKGFESVPEVEVALIVDLVRDYGVEKALVTLREISEVKEFGVIGIGIGGSEERYPPGVFLPVYEKARSLGFHTTAHAGEVAGAESIWGAIRELRVDRIGHGTRAFEDEELLTYLCRNKIPLEMCPISNVKTGAVSSIEEHPIREYWSLGIAVTVNTDDPGMFGNTLAEEFLQLEEKLGFTREEILLLILESIEDSWLPDARKKSLAEEFLAHNALKYEEDA